MEKITVKIKKLPHFQGDLPRYETLHASGCDLRAQLGKTILLEPGQRILVSTGLAFEIPPGFEMQIRPRSGWAIKKGISVVNTPGTIDADYRGEVQVGLINLGQESMEIQDQDRICQAVIAPVVQAEFTVVDALASTDRGAGGFGSTGMQ
jgi:dUTP pyrophosphatase